MIHKSYTHDVVYLGSERGVQVSIISYNVTRLSRIYLIFGLGASKLVSNMRPKDNGSSRNRWREKEGRYSSIIPNVEISVSCEKPEAAR